MGEAEGWPPPVGEGAAAPGGMMVSNVLRLLPHAQLAPANATSRTVPPTTPPITAARLRGAGDGSAAEEEEGVEEASRGAAVAGPGKAAGPTAMLAPGVGPSPPPARGFWLDG